MKRTAIALSLGLVAALATVPLARAQNSASAITEAEAHSHRRRGLSLLLSAHEHGCDAQAAHQHRTRQGIGGPMNAFDNIPAFPTADMGRWCGPISTRCIRAAGSTSPRADGHLGARHRRPLLPSADARHVDRCVRVAGLAYDGHKGGQFPADPAQLERSVPAGFTRISAPTPYVWIIGRTKTDGPADYGAVHAIQKGYKITPLSGWGKPPVQSKPASTRASTSRRRRRRRSTRCKAPNISLTRLNC